VKECSGSDVYEKILVVGDLGEDYPNEAKEETKKYGINLLSMKGILKDVRKSMRGVYMDSAGRYIQILSTFLEKDHLQCP